MNRKSVKTSFIIRTIVALTLIFVAIACMITYYCAVSYVDELFQDAEVIIAELETELRECRDTETDSTEYRDGVNVAQANALIEYYRFLSLQTFEHKDAEADLVLYHLTYNKNHKIAKFQEVAPETLVMMEAPFQKYGAIVVFEDVCSKEDCQRIQNMVEQEAPVSVSNAKGYKSGRFFYPVEMTIKNNRETFTLKTDVQGTHQDLETCDFSNMEVVIPGDENTEDGQLRTEFEKDMASMGDNPGSGTSSIVGYAYSDYQLRTSCRIATENYVSNLYIKAEPLKYAVSHIKESYLMLFLILVLVGWGLISSHTKIIEANMETESRRRRMMDSMAHEMKTPLGVIRNYGEVLLEEENEESRAYFTERIIEESDDLNKVIVSMLDLSKMEAGTYPMQLSSFSVGKVAQKELERRKIILQRNHIQVELEINEQTYVLADEKLISNLVANFLSNAIGHTPEGGKIKMTIKQQGKDVYIAARNQGQQIHPEEMEKLWNSFYRNTDREGSGLGLAIVRNTCMMHRGSYGCRNENDGVTFWAKIRSMENAQAKVEAATGPVLGIRTNQTELKGLAMIALGFLLQGVLGGDMYWMLYLQPMFTGLLSESNVWAMFSQAVNILSITLGSVIMMYGIFLQFKKAPAYHPYKIVSLLPVCSSTVLLCFCLGWSTQMPLDVDYQMTITGILMYASLFALSVMMFHQCFRIAKNFRNTRVCKIMQRKGIMYLLLFAVWIILVYKFQSYYAIEYGWIILSIYASYSWLQMYRYFKLNGDFWAA